MRSKEYNGSNRITTLVLLTLVWTIDHLVIGHSSSLSNPLLSGYIHFPFSWSIYDHSLHIISSTIPAPLSYILSVSSANQWKAKNQMACVYR
jgi:hypothetical protein